MKGLFFVVITLLTTVSAIAEPRKYGPLILDFSRAQKMGQSIVVPAINAQKQPLYIAVVCAERLFNSLVLERNGMAGMSRLLLTKQKLLPMCAILFEQLQKQRAESSGLLPLEINHLCQ